jgi:hypothetical protein
VCAPAEPSWDVTQVLGVQDRPFRDGTVSMAARRGSVSLIRPILLTDTDAGLDTWENVTDVTPGGDIKNVGTITCPTPTTYTIGALTTRIKVGNFANQFFPEWVQHWQDTIAVEGARIAERRLIAQFEAAANAAMTRAAMVAQTGHTGATGQMGMTRELLFLLDLFLAQIRNRRRAPTMRFRLWIPRWLLAALRADLALEMPGSTVEKLTIAEQQIASWLETRNVAVSLLLEGASGQDFSAISAGAVANFPATQIMYLAPEGAVHTLTSPELNIGVYRDSALIDTNDFGIFSEIFEGLAFTDDDRYKLTTTFKPNGNVASALDIS